MDPEVLRVVIGLVVFFALAVAGIRGVRFVGLGMAALAIALGLEALRALDYAEALHEFRCDDSCPERPGVVWQFTVDAWQWDGLWIAALAGTIAIWLSATLGAVAGAAGLRPAVRPAAPRIYVLAALTMAIAVASFGVFTVIVAPLGDRYGI